MEKKNVLKKIFNRRSLKYGSNSAILIVAVIAIAVLVNLLVGTLDLKLDLTPNKLFSLSDVTKTELDKLEQDVEIIGLFDDGKISADSEFKQVTDLLALYQKNPHIKVKYIDPDKDPTIINELDPDGTMELKSTNFVVRSVVNGNEKRKKLQYYDLFAVQFDQSSFQTYTTGSTAEQGFTGAIKYVTAEVTPVVYFTEGHDEIDMDYEYKNVKDYLEKNNFLVKKLNLISVDKVPEDAEMVIVASPGKDITLNEKDVLDEYLNNGGNAIFMFDYQPNDPSYDQFNSLFSKFNLAVNYDRVKETNENNHIPNDPNTILLSVNSNSIIPQRFNTVLNNSRSVSILKNAKEYITATSLMRTSENAIGEMVDKSRGDDLNGPLDIAVAVEYKGGMVPSKIIVMGNASFISDSAYQNFGNYYNNSMVFFLHSMNWMIDKQEEIIVPAKDYENNRITITQQQTNIVGGALLILFPLLILSTGLVVFLRRRHL